MTATGRPPRTGAVVLRARPADPDQGRVRPGHRPATSVAYMDEDPSGTGPGPVTSGPPAAARDDEESLSAPSVPSFASLRSTRPRSPADLLVSRQDEAAEPVSPSAGPVSPSAGPVPPSARPGPPRPPEWADLWLLGLRVVRWCVLQPLTTARRLLG